MPTDIGSAHERIDALKAEIASIQDQLSKRKYSKGRSSEDTARYRAWRHKALDALRWKQVEFDALKTWKRDYYLERGTQLCADETTVGLLHQIYRVARHTLAVDGVVLTSEEQDSMDKAQLYLRSVDLGA